MITDTRTNLQRIKDNLAESFDELALEVLDSKSITIEEAAKLLMQEIEDWLVYYKSRYEFYEGLKQQIGQRVH